MIHVIISHESMVYFFVKSTEALGTHLLLYGNLVQEWDFGEFEIVELFHIGLEVRAVHFSVVFDFA